MFRECMTRSYSTKAERSDQGLYLGEVGSGKDARRVIGDNIDSTELLPRWESVYHKSTEGDKNIHMNMTMKDAKVARRLRGTMNSSKKRFLPMCILFSASRRVWISDEKILSSEEYSMPTFEHTIKVTSCLYRLVSQLGQRFIRLVVSSFRHVPSSCKERQHADI